MTASTAINLAAYLIALAFGIFAAIRWRRQGQPVLAGFGLTVDRRTLPDIGAGLAITTVAMIGILVVLTALGALFALAAGLRRRGRLSAEAARKLGFGARLVSGYLHDPDHDLVGSAEAGSTHAWAEVFVPGAGWITFDPTNRSVGGRNLIPVAVARDISQCTPVSGSYFGVSDNFLSMDVTVSVTS